MCVNDSVTCVLENLYLAAWTAHWVDGLCNTPTSTQLRKCTPSPALLLLDQITEGLGGGRRAMGLGLDLPGLQRGQQVWWRGAGPGGHLHVSPISAPNCHVAPQGLS